MLGQTPTEIHTKKSFSRQKSDRPWEKTQKVCQSHSFDRFPSKNRNFTKIYQVVFVVDRLQEGGDANCTGP
jgi:hypothetical protein